MLHISTDGTGLVPTRSALKTSRRELSEALPFGVGTLLVAEQSNLEERPKVGDIHRPIPVHYCPCQTLRRTVHGGGCGLRIPR